MRNVLLMGIGTFLCMHAYAGGMPMKPTTYSDADAFAAALAKANAEARANSLSNSNSQSFSDSNATANGGNGVGIGHGGDADGGDATLNYNEEQVRQAPGVALVVPQSTAPFQKCFGLGGSDEKGSGVIGWCWLQRDTYAASRANTLAQLGLAYPAAEAYCSRRLHWRDFGGRDLCITGMRAALTQEPEVVEVEVLVDNPQCSEKLARCEDVTKGVLK